jgi:RHS repeat-associated protein
MLWIYHRVLRPPKYAFYQQLRSGHCSVAHPLTLSSHENPKDGSNHKTCAESATQPRTFNPGFGYSLYRMYYPNEGRWMTTDPVRGKPGDPQSENLYPYVRNNPLMFTDPLGDRFSGHICQPAGGSWIPWSIVRGECVPVGAERMPSGYSGNLLQSGNRISFFSPLTPTYKSAIAGLEQFS